MAMFGGSRTNPTGYMNTQTGTVTTAPPAANNWVPMYPPSPPRQPIDWEMVFKGGFALLLTLLIAGGIYGAFTGLTRQQNYDYNCTGSTSNICVDAAKARLQHEINEDKRRDQPTGIQIYVAPGASASAPPHAMALPAAPAASAPAASRYPEGKVFHNYEQFVADCKQQGGTIAPLPDGRPHCHRDAKVSRG